MSKFLTGVAVYDDNGEIEDFYTFGSNVMLKTYSDSQAREVMLVGREVGVHVEEADWLLYIDLEESKFDNNRRFIPEKMRTKRIQVVDIENIDNLQKYTADEDHVYTY